MGESARDSRISDYAEELLTAKDKVIFEYQARVQELEKWKRLALQADPNMFHIVAQLDALQEDNNVESI